MRSSARTLPIGAALACVAVLSIGALYPTLSFLRSTIASSSSLTRDDLRGFEENVGQVPDPNVRFFAQFDTVSWVADNMGLSALSAASETADPSVRFRFFPDATHVVVSSETTALYDTFYLRNTHTLASSVYDRIVFSAPTSPLRISVATTPTGIEFDVLVPPAVKPRARVHLSGAFTVSRQESGCLILATPSGEVVIKPPIAYEISAGGVRRRIRSYLLYEEPYLVIEASRKRDDSNIIIDPEVSFSAFVGGSRRDATAATVPDPNGGYFVVSNTASRNLSTTAGGLKQTLNPNDKDIVITKVDRSGSVVYRTYMGGVNHDAAASAVVDSTGALVVCGWSAGHFPTTEGAWMSTVDEYPAAVLAKVSPDGNALLFSTYVAPESRAAHLALAADGSIAVVGSIFSARPPPPLIAAAQGTFQRESAGETDGFVARFTSTGSILFFTFFGGEHADSIHSIAIASSGDFVVAGWTESHELPAAAQQTHGLLNGSRDCFVAVLDGSGQTLKARRYLGGAGRDRCNAVASPGGGPSIVVAGQTESSDFPVTLNARHTSFLGGGADAFLTRLSADLSSISYSTYLGSPHECALLTDHEYFQCDSILALAATPSGIVYATGITGKELSGAAQAVQSSVAGESDVFLLRLDASNDIPFVSPYGGTNVEAGTTIGVSGNTGLITIGGVTRSADFPTLHMGSPTVFGGGDQDGFALRISDTLCSVTLGATSSWFASASGQFQLGVIAPPTCSWQAYSTHSWITITSAAGSGNGTVQYSITANSTGVLRVGTIRVFDTVFTLRQVF